MTPMIPHTTALKCVCVCACVCLNVHVPVYTASHANMENTTVIRPISEDS